MDLACAALEAGAQGFLPKGAAPEDLVDPLLAAATGWSVVPADVLAALTLDRRHVGLDRDVGGAERHLWRRIAEGRSTAQIAAELHVSERTGKRMSAALLRTLGVATRAEAAALAGRAGIVDQGRPAAQRRAGAGQ